MTIDDIRLEMTCGACPEQYDALVGDSVVGYLRLRHGYFYVQCPASGPVVYEAHPNGDGIFHSDERDFYLNMAKQAILLTLEKEVYESDNSGWEGF